MKTVLLLDRTYAPIRIITRRRAIELVIARGVAEPLELYESAVSEFDMAVVRLTKRVVPKIYVEQTKFCRKSVLIRDKHSCVYCGVGGNAWLTIDHVLPRSRGGSTSYMNCVTACFDCNQKKGNLTPEEASMRILRPPTIPTNGIMVNRTDIPKEWAPFMGAK